MEEDTPVDLITFVNSILESIFSNVMRISKAINFTTQ